MIKEFLIKQLKDAADRIEQESCDLSNEDMEEILRLISRLPMSKSEAFLYLGISRSKFDLLIKEGKLPEGLKRVGFKEKVWYKNELIL